jgi:hypothetical protein
MLYMSMFPGRTSPDRNGLLGAQVVVLTSLQDLGNQKIVTIQ